MGLVIGEQKNIELSELGLQLIRRHKRIQLINNVWRLSALVLMIIVFGIVSPDFLTQANWLNTSVYATTTVLLALGETFVIITAGIDLSVGAILGVSSSVSALYLAGHHPFASNVAFSIAAVLGILSGIGMGALNGLIISYVGLSPFITTLGTLGIGTGITYLLTGGADVIVPASVGVYGNAVYFNWLPITLF